MSTKKKAAARGTNGKSNGHGNTALQKTAATVSRQKHASEIKSGDPLLVPINQVHQLAGIFDSMELLRVLT